MASALVLTNDAVRVSIEEMNKDPGFQSFCQTYGAEESGSPDPSGSCWS